MSVCPSQEFWSKTPLKTPPQKERPRGPTSPSLMNNVRKNIAEANKAAPIIFQVTCQVVFHLDKPALSPPITANREIWTALLVGAALTDPAITKTTAPNTTTPEAVGRGKKIQTAHDQRKVLSQHPDKPLTLTVKSRRQPVMERVTATHTMLSCAKTCPKTGQHARTWEPHPITPTDAWSLRCRALGYYPRNRAHHPDQRAQPYGTFQQRVHPVLKPPRQLLYATSCHPTIINTLTPDRWIGCSGPASAMPTHWRRQRLLPSKHDKPPQSPPQGRRRYALWCLQGLGAPKSCK